MDVKYKQTNKQKKGARANNKVLSYLIQIQIQYTIVYKTTYLTIS